MTARLDPFQVAPRLMRPMLALDAAVVGSGLEHDLVLLVKLRASQINGCAYCIHLHASEALKAGEGELRLLLLDAWRESSLYSPRERAALAWTESLTLIAETQAPDDDYAVLAEHFTEEERVQLTLLIGAINVWNRVAVGFRSPHPATASATA